MTDAAVNAAARAGEAAVLVRQVVDLAAQRPAPRLEVDLAPVAAVCRDADAALTAAADVLGRFEARRLVVAVAVARAALVAAEEAASASEDLADADEHLRAAATGCHRADSALRSFLTESP